MHLYITLFKEKGFSLPIHYNHIVQSMVYNILDGEQAKFLHDKGYVIGSRKFSLFAVSNLLGDFSIEPETGRIHFAEQIRLVLSSPIDRFCDSIATSLLLNPNIRLGSSILQVQSIEAYQHIAQEPCIRVHTLSPIVAYSTLFKADGKKYTCYFQPGDGDFVHLIRQNLLKKHAIITGKVCDETQFHIKRIGPAKMRIVMYKGTVIKAYASTLELSGDPSLLQTALDCGIGSKNAQGFGCIEPVKK
jgi:CRISPR-associated endoribonuclease Cas6